tara:strand:+ start:1177 stop:1563 length:387 start_codon:yes stop_codon:yes gene_type:complete
MRKTAVTFAIVMFTVVSGAFAVERTETTATVKAKVVFSAEINSFCKAIMEGDYDTVKKMIEFGEDVNQKSLGKTPAIFAARYNKVKILQLLIDNGADLKQKCNKGWTIQQHAERANATDALALILENI